MHPFGVVECHVLGAVAAEDALGFAAEHDFLDALDVAAVLPMRLLLLLVLFLSCPCEFQLVVHNGLLLVSIASVISAFHELLD